MITVFDLHRVSNMEWFEQFILMMKRKCVFVDIHTLYKSYKKRAPTGNICHITVDDGDVSFYNVIYPILLKHNIPATLFVSPLVCSIQKNYWFQDVEQCSVDGIFSVLEGMGVRTAALFRYNIMSILKTFRIDDIEYIVEECKRLGYWSNCECSNMTIDQLLEVHRSGLVYLGAHTMHHPILANESFDRAQSEIEQSIYLLSKLLNSQIQYFSYPNGIPILDYSRREMDILLKAGVKMAFSTESKSVSAQQHPMSLPRVCISDNEKYSLINAKLLLGSIWNTLKSYKPSGEFNERKRILAETSCG